MLLNRLVLFSVTLGDPNHPIFDILYRLSYLHSEFGRHVECSKCEPTDSKLALKWAWLGREPFKF